MKYLDEDVVVRLEDEDGRAAGGCRVCCGYPLVRHQVLVAHVAVRVFKVA